MAIISRLAVLLGLDAGEFNAGLGKAKDKVESFGLGAKVSLAAVGFAFVNATKSAVEYADKIADVAKANDVSVSSVLRLSQALQVNGGQAENSAKLMASFNMKIDEAAQGSDKAQKAFGRIGISIKDLKTLSPEQLFEKTVKSLGAIEETSKRNALAMEMFGKAIKGVDIKGLADSMDDNKGSFKDTEEAFMRINSAMDKLAIAGQTLKVNTAQNSVGIVEAVANWAEKYITHGKEMKEMNDQLLKQYGQIDYFLWKIGAKELELKKPEFGSVQGATNVSGALTGIGGIADPNRQVREVAIADTIRKQNEALAQQVLTMNMEASSVGKVVSQYDKLNIEFEKGGKYAEVSAKARADAQASALKLDIAKKDEFLRQQQEEAKNAQELLRIEIAMAGASDTQMKKALDLKKVDQDILDIKRKYPYATDAEIEAIRKLKQETVGLQEQATRVGNTFQNGWSNAFQNWKEKATDSFAMGQQAFENMASSMTNALDEFVRTGKISFKSLIADMIMQLIRLQLQAQVSGFFKMLGGIFGIGGSSSGAGMFTGSTGEVGGSILIGARAGGGDVSSGTPYLVGENGPELVIPKSSGTVIPSGKTSSMLNGGNQGQVVYNGTVIQNMSAIDTQSGVQFLAKNKQAIWAANQSAQRAMPQSRR
jgi:hypothetical protein